VFHKPLELSHPTCHSPSFGPWSKASCILIAPYSELGVLIAYVAADVKHYAPECELPNSDARPLGGRQLQLAPVGMHQYSDMAPSDSD
jgi:hypothetical protein